MMSTRRNSAKHYWYSGGDFHDDDDILIPPAIRPQAYKTYNERLIACNGDCGSPISKIIDYIVCEKDVNDFLSEFNKMDETIKDAFWCYGSPIRQLLADLMKEKNIINNDALYSEMYGYLTNDNCFIVGDEWTAKIKGLLLQLGLDNHRDIMETLANATCRIPNRSLLAEVSAYYQRKGEEMRNKFDTEYYQNRIQEMKQFPKYIHMKSKNLELTNLEILSILLYCDCDIFCEQMRKSQRDEHLNSCEWRQLFYHLNNAINKLHTIFHLKNKQFYLKYITLRRKCNNKLYRGIHGVIMNSDTIDTFSLHTITSFSDNFGVAKEFTLNKGMVLIINDAFKQIYDGKLRAADVSWISAHCAENEWILLPTNLISVSKISKHHDDYNKYIRDPENVEIYETDNIPRLFILDACRGQKRVMLKFSLWNKVDDVIRDSIILPITRDLSCNWINELIISSYMKIKKNVLEKDNNKEEDSMDLVRTDDSGLSIGDLCSQQTINQLILQYEQMLRQEKDVT